MSAENTKSNMLIDEPTRTKKPLVIAVVAVLLAVILALLLLLRSDGYVSIKVLELFGQVSYDRDGQTDIPVYDDLKLSGGDNMKTGGDSYARLSLDSDKYVYIEQQSFVAFESTKKDRIAINLKEGAIVNEIENKLKSGQSYEVQSPNALMAVRGTRFRVATYVDAQGIVYTRVSGVEGTVECQLVYEDGSRSDKTVLTQAGNESLMYYDRDNSITDFVYFDDVGEPLPPGVAGNETRSIRYEELPLQTLEYFMERATEDGVDYSISVDKLQTYIQGYDVNSTEPVINLANNGPDDPDDPKNPDGGDEIDTENIENTENDDNIPVAPVANTTPVMPADAQVPATENNPVQETIEPDAPQPDMIPQQPTTGEEAENPEGEEEKEPEKTPVDNTSNNDSSSSDSSSSSGGGSSDGPTNNPQGGDDKDPTTDPDNGDNDPVDGEPSDLNSPQSPTTINDAVDLLNSGYTDVSINSSLLVNNNSRITVGNDQTLTITRTEGDANPINLNGLTIRGGTINLPYGVPITGTVSFTDAYLGSEMDDTLNLSDGAIVTFQSTNPGTINVDGDASISIDETFSGKIVAPTVQSKSVNLSIDPDNPPTDLEISGGIATIGADDANNKLENIKFNGEIITFSKDDGRIKNMYFTDYVCLQQDNHYTIYYEPPDAPDA